MGWHDDQDGVVPGSQIFGMSEDAYLDKTLESMKPAGTTCVASQLRTYLVLGEEYTTKGTVCSNAVENRIYLAANLMALKDKAEQDNFVIVEILGVE